MIISTEKKIIYIRIPKNASTSIRAVLKRWRNRDLEKGIKSHILACDLKKKFPKKWEKYTSCTFVRNPWVEAPSPQEWGILVSMTLHLIFLQCRNS